MYLGSIVEHGPVGEVMTDPRHPYTRALLSAVPRLDAVEGAPALQLAGEPPSPLSPPSGCAFHPRCPAALPACAIERPALLEVSGRRVACPVLPSR
jgi:oligopeptide/dipeptide ABC transporter ATP-binding protein